jgi:hypothetical protein
MVYVEINRTLPSFNLLVMNNILRSLYLIFKVIASILTEGRSEMHEIPKDWRMCQFYFGKFTNFSSVIISIKLP